MSKKHENAAHQLARLERATVILDRIYAELLAMPESARRRRLILANRAAVAGMKTQAEETRAKLRPPVAANSV